MDSLGLNGFQSDVHLTREEKREEKRKKGVGGGGGGSLDRELRNRTLKPFFPLKEKSVEKLLNMNAQAVMSHCSAAGHTRQRLRLEVWSRMPMFLPFRSVSGQRTSKKCLCSRFG